MFVEDKPLYWCKTNNYLPVLTALGCHGMKLIRFLGPMTDGVNMSRIFVKSKLIKIELHGNVLYHHCISFLEPLPCAYYFDNQMLKRTSEK